MAIPACSYCSGSFFNESQEIPAVLNGPSLTVTLTTGTCAIVKDKSQQGMDDLLEGSLTCVGPDLSYEKVRSLLRHQQCSDIRHNAFAMMTSDVACTYPVLW